MCKKDKTAKTAKNIETIKELVSMMSEHDLVEIKIVDGDSKIHLKRPNPQASAPVITQVPMHTPAMPMSAPAAPAPAAAPTAAPATAATPSDDTPSIDSPIVGTFYTAPSPDSDPFVKVGDRVTADTVVCIIEAMKVMNEIKAEMDGIVEQVCVSNGEAVEFGQALFKVKAG